jgi:hypothetical protein
LTSGNFEVAKNTQEEKIDLEFVILAQSQKCVRAWQLTLKKMMIHGYCTASVSGYWGIDLFIYFVLTLGWNRSAGKVEKISSRLMIIASSARYIKWRGNIRRKMFTSMGKNILTRITLLKWDAID